MSTLPRELDELLQDRIRELDEACKIAREAQSASHALFQARLREARRVREEEWTLADLEAELGYERAAHVGVVK